MSVNGINGASGPRSVDFEWGESSTDPSTVMDFGCQPVPVPLHSTTTGTHKTTTTTNLFIRRDRTRTVPP